MAAPELLYRAYSFAAIRDPLDRFFSAFDFAMHRGGEHVSMSTKPAEMLRGIANVSQYLDFLEKNLGDPLQVDNTARPQWWFVPDVRQVIQTTALFRIDDPALPIETLIKESVGRAVPRLNRTKRTTFATSDDEIARIVRLYQSDFTLYYFLRDYPTVTQGRKIADIQIGFGTRICYRK